MGLDVTAYSNLRHIGKHEKNPLLNEGELGGPDGSCYYDNHVEAFAYDCFPASFRGIPILGSQQVGSAAFIQGGCYEITDATETHDFGNSYGGYNRWRDDLCRQFNPNTEPGEPFYELIWFADNEGAIGPDAAVDLLKDFRDYEDQYHPAADSTFEVEHYCKDYRNWMRAMELAAKGGLVRFH